MTSLLDKWKLLGRIIADNTLPPSAAVVAYVLLNHHNGETGRCDPSRETIAKQIGITSRSVTTALTALAAGGYFRRRLRGYHQSSSYVPLVEIELQGETDAKISSSLEADFQSEGGKEFPGWKNSVKQTGSQFPPNPSIEPVKKREGSPPDVTLVAIPGGKSSKAANPTKRNPQLYLAKHGCTIDSYDPVCSAMASWASDKAPLVNGPLSPETVDDIKDIWRRRGENPKDFDATYRTYLRQRQKWAEEKQAESAAAHDPILRAGMV